MVLSFDISLHGSHSPLSSHGILIKLSPPLHPKVGGNSATRTFFVFLHSLSYNPIPVEGGRAIAEALRVNSTLTNLK